MKLGVYDKTKIIARGYLSNDDYNVLALLYQPIIGMRAYGIFLTLHAFLQRTDWQREMTHKEIIDAFGISLTIFEVERKKIEAIGLLIVYENNSEYIYELKKPCSASSFLKDGILGMYLRSTVGEKQYKTLVKSFKLPNVINKDYKNTTSSFDDVFKQLDVKMIKDNNQYQDDKKTSIRIANSSFNFDIFLSGISPNFIDKGNISEKFIEKIKNTAYKYNLNEEDMNSIYFKSLVKDVFSYEKIDIEAGKLLNRKSVVKKPNKISLEYTVETILKKYVGHLTPGRLEFIHKLKKDSNMNDEVFNAFLVYVIKKTDNKFPAYSYFEKVMKTWKEYDFSTLDEVIAYSRKKEMKKEKVFEKDDWFAKYLAKVEEDSK